MIIITNKLCSQRLVAVGGSENVKTIFNLCPSIGQPTSLQWLPNRILNPCLQCVQMQALCKNNIFHQSLKEKVHRSNIKWAVRPKLWDSFDQYYYRIRESYTDKISRSWKPMRWCHILFKITHRWNFLLKFNSTTIIGEFKLRSHKPITIFCLVIT